MSNVVSRKMSLRQICIAVAGVLLCLACPVTAVYAQNYNNLHVSGTLVNWACTLSPKSIDISLDFGEIRDSFFYIAPYRTKGVPFDIVLENCDLKVAKTVTMKISGTPDKEKPELLDGKDSGLGFGVEMPDGTPLLPGVASHPFSLKKSKLTLSLDGFVEAVPRAIKSHSVKPGDFHATADFELMYP
ncbi:fimbrial protein [Enterobacter bugandensis]|uniref:fimbrial protein n=1 Tax=Enterobacter bugandensis TaxID=881260 RepID=UPI000668874E|nr:fimbrial protein [Enterobacter bugandensis]